VFDEDISKDFGLRTQLLSIPQCVVCIPFDETLIGEHRATVHVDADEGPLAGGTKRECSPCIVAEDVEADWKFDGSADGASGGSHGGNSFGADVCFGERDIAEIFDEERMGAAPFICAGVGYRSGNYSFQVAFPARRTGEGTEVDDTN
jgi:hypothetical protein